MRLSSEPHCAFLTDNFPCMTILHGKSPCCRGRVRRFGARRRQCAACGKTWRVRKKKRGRKTVRVSVDVARRFVLNRILPTRAVRSGVRQTRNERQYRLSRSRAACARALPWPTLPDTGPLVAIADALVKYIGGEWHTWYFILVRRPDDDDAIILPPYHTRGTETVAGWRAAFDAQGASVLSRICALVCDGHRGLRYEALWREWVLQRCHFHLIARIQSRRSKWRTSQHRDEGWRIYGLVKRVLIVTEGTNLSPLIEELEEIAWRMPSPDLKNTLKGFVSHHGEFRSYLMRPDLRLPVTSNTAETLIGLIEDVSRRARGFQKISTFNEWVWCVIKVRKTIRCTPYKSTK